MRGELHQSATSATGKTAGIDEIPNDQEIGANVAAADLPPPSVLGCNPTNPGDDASLLPPLDNTGDPDFFIFTFNRVMPPMPIPTRPPERLDRTSSSPNPKPASPVPWK